MPYVKSMDRDQLMMTTLDMLIDQDSIVRVMDVIVLLLRMNVLLPCHKSISLSKLH